MDDYQEKSFGQLKVILSSVENIPVDSDASLCCDVGVGEDVGTTAVARDCGPSAKFETSFPFEYFGESLLTIEVKDQGSGKIVAAGEHYIKGIMDEREWTGIIELSPAGRAFATLHFVETPASAPKFLTVNIVKALGLGDGKHSDPYVKLHLGDGGGANEKKTSVKKGQNPVWDETFDFNYSNEQQILFQVYDKDSMNKDDLIGECMFDLWGARRGGKMSVGGELPLSVKKDDVLHNVGKLLLSVLFWNPDEPKAAMEPPAAVEAIVPAVVVAEVLQEDPPIIESREIDPPELGVPSPLESHSTETIPPILDEEMMSDAFDRAKRARDNAIRAREAADAARESSNATPLSADARDDADQANLLADDAEREARKAQDSCDLLARNPADAPVILEAIADAEKRTARDADRAEECAKDAAKHAADEEARRAKLAARDAVGCSREIGDLREKHPLVPKLPEIFREAEELAELAGMEAKRARKAADEADAPGCSILEAKECERRAREARRKAEKLADECAELLRQAKKLIRDRQRVEGKKERLRMKRERDRLRQNEFDQDKLRAEEHERELERRRLGRGTGVDANENTMYDGVLGYSYHNRLGETVPPRNGMCCGGPAVGGDSNELVPSVPKHEIRGLYPNDDYDGAELLYQTGGAIPDPIIEGELGYGKNRKPLCWCFGCGCLRCCGEC